MKYKFIGENGSCGFINGEIYDLELYIERLKVESYIDFHEFYDGVVAYSKHRRVPYSSMEKFKENWEKVEG